jgi:hypothetical protein
VAVNRIEDEEEDEEEDEQSQNRENTTGFGWPRVGARQ